MRMRRILHESRGNGGMGEWSIGALEYSSVGQMKLWGYATLESGGFDFEIERRNESRLTLLLIFSAPNTPELLNS